jgi:hypothetical protein
MNLLRRSMLAVATAVVAGSLGAAAQAAFVPGEDLVNPGLTGNTQHDAWVGLTSANYPGFPGFPGTGAWPHPMAPNQPGSVDGELIKLANGNGGGPYPTSGGIYFGGFSGDINNLGGTLAVKDATPVADFKNVVFQVQIGEAWTYDFYNHALPTLSYNGGSQNLAATTSLVLSKFDNGTVTMPTGDETVYINTYLLQWDLSGISSPITDFSIQFSGTQHSQLYALQLDQSDVYKAYGTVVPEPSTILMTASGVLPLALLTLRKRHLA